mgnify:CR=1 FL=1
MLVQHVVRSSCGMVTASAGHVLASGALAHLQDMCWHHVRSHTCRTCAGTMCDHTLAGHVLTSCALKHDTACRRSACRRAAVGSAH